MNLDRKRLAPYAFLVGLAALLFAGGWYVVQRQTNLGFQIAIGVAFAGLAAGVMLDPQRVQRWLSGRQARYGSNALLLTLAVAGILGVINYLAYHNPQIWDLTEDQQYSLAPETLALLDSLEQPIEIVGFYSPDQARARENIEPLLERYRVESGDLIEVRYVDPIANPLEADRYEITRDGTLVVVQGDQSHELTFANEREITGGIIRVTQEGERLVTMVSGHGEHETGETAQTGYSQAERALTTKNYAIEQLNLAAQADVPAGSDVLVLAGPQSPLTQVEVEAIDRYLQAGGSLLAMIEPSVLMSEGVSDDPLVSYLAETWRVELHNDVVVDLDSSRPFAGIAASYGTHPITDRMGNLATYFPTARSLALLGSEGGEGPVATALAMTGLNSWGETNLEGLSQQSQIAFDEGADFAGPLTLAAAVDNAATGARVVVIGDSEFAANGDIFGAGNRDFFVNAVDWLTHQEELIQITPRQTTSRIILPPTVQSVGLILLTVVILIPGAVIGLGVSVWWRRRRAG